MVQPQVASLPAIGRICGLPRFERRHQLTGSKVLTVTLTMSGVGVEPETHRRSVIDHFDCGYCPRSSGTNSTPTGLPQVGNALYVYHAIPTITNVTQVRAANGTITLAKVTIASNGGQYHGIN